MTLTITLSQATLNALAMEAAARNTTCEQVASMMLEDCFTPAQSSDPVYEAWFKAKYEEGKAAYLRGDFCTHEDVQRDMAERKAKFLAQIKR